MRYHRALRRRCRATRGCHSCAAAVALIAALWRPQRGTRTRSLRVAPPICHRACASPSRLGPAAAATRVCRR
ncbi:hypothetical protein AHAS_Ahas09G0136700 [Arachis hypogaea]